MVTGAGGVPRPEATARLLRERAGRGGAWIAVDGPSMLPTIRPPARVWVVAADGPGVGEVWVFVDDEGEVLAHRFVRQFGGGLLRFKGDGAPLHDRPVGPERLVGRVERAIDERGERAVPRRRLWAVREVVLAAARRRVVAAFGRRGL